MLNSRSLFLLCNSFVRYLSFLRYSSHIYRVSRNNLILFKIVRLIYCDANLIQVLHKSLDSSQSSSQRYKCSRYPLFSLFTAFKRSSMFLHTVPSMISSVVFTTYFILQFNWVKLLYGVLKLCILLIRISKVQGRDIWRYWSPIERTTSSNPCFRKFSFSDCLTIQS